VSRKVFLWRRDGGEPEPLVLEGRAREWSVSLRGAKVSAEVLRLPDGRLSILLSDGRQVSGRASLTAGGETSVSSSRGIVRLSLLDPLHDRLARSPSAGGSPEGEEEIRASMPGRVIQVSVAPGDSIEKGALLLVLEAMKMQNEIRAERAGLVKEVGIRAGEAVDGGAVMLTVQSVRS
jgi:biotin carboxyl carrier protein